MIKVDPNNALFKQLKKDYDSHKKNKLYQSQLQSGFDYMEAMIKFFGVLSISVVKSIDETLYKKIFTNNFKLSPSLGDYKSLATTPFSVNSKKIISTLTANELYNFLDNLFSKKIELKLTDTASILEDKEKTIKVKSTLFLLDEYAVSFRNKIKGHGASFKSDEKKLRDLILKNLDELLLYMENDYIQIAQEIDFFSNGHNTNEILIKYKASECKLLPIISYITCDKYSCNDKHRTKLFFYNDGKATKSHYLDYSYNHFHQFTQTNEIYQNLEILQNEILHSTSNTHRQSLLLSDFVGRIKELKDTKAHILNSLERKQSSFISLMGIPGIGKSAFLTQLQQSLIDDETLKNKFNSYTFYVQKDNMGVRSEEDRYLWKHFHAYFSNQGISINTNENEVFNLRDNLEQLFKAYEENTRTKPLLLIIDGLDEFTNPSDIIQSIPLNFNSKIHLIYSSRPYSNIQSIITSTLSTSEHLNIFKFELDKLLINEVEELLSHVLSKDIPRESKDYKEIVEIIAKHSESLPLYIYYITQALKEKNIADSLNVTKHIKEWAKQLPPKLSDFYLQQFKNASSLSRNILLMLYLSKSSISKEDVYTILKNIRPEDFKMTDGKTIDEVLFIDKYFNAIEVFLHIDSDNKYNFYHLSVREQIVSYLQELKQAFRFNQTQLKEVIYESVVDHYSDYIENMLYLKKNSDIYNLLVQLTKKVDKDDTPSYYKDNYFHLLNTLIWANIHIGQINHEDMHNEEYVSLLETKEITKETIQEIQHFYELFENKKEKHLYEIRYAYELAFIAKDYSQVLVYKDMYEDFVHDMFLEIVLNLDKLEYIQKFIKHKDDWNNALSKEVQDFFVNTIEHYETLDDSFSEVLEFFTESHISKLCYKLSIKYSLYLTEKINNKFFQSVSYSNIIQNSNDTTKSLKLIKLIQTNYIQLNTLSEITLAKQNLSEAFNIIELNSSNNETKIKTLISIAFQANHMSQIEKELKIKEKIINKTLKLNLDYRYFNIDYITFLYKALETIEERTGETDKILSLLAMKTSDKDRALEITNSIIDIEEKEKVYIQIISDICDTEKALEIVNLIKDINIRQIAYIIIASKMNNIENIPKLFRLNINIHPGYFYNFNIRKYLYIILDKINNIEYFFKTMPKSIISPYKISLFTYKAITTKKNNFLKKSLLHIIQIHSHNTKQYILSLIIENTNDIEKALKIVDLIDSPNEQQKAYFTIASKTDDIEKALKIVDLIDSPNEQQKAYFTIASKTDDIEKALEIIKQLHYYYQDTIYSIVALKINNPAKAYNVVALISSYTNKLDIYYKILSNIDNNGKYLKSITNKKENVIAKIALEVKKNDIKKALKIVDSIKNTNEQQYALISIVSNIQNIDKALEIIDLIKESNNKEIAYMKIIPKIKDIEKALKIINLIKKYSLDDNHFPNGFKDNLISIITTTDELNLAINIINTFTNEFYQNEKTALLKFIINKTSKIDILFQAFFMKDISLNLTLIKKILQIIQLDSKSYQTFYNQLFLSEINIVDTLPIVAELSDHSILNYYNISIDSQPRNSTLLTPLIKELQDLCNNDKLEKEKKETFRGIKNKLRDNTVLLKEFISHYGKSLQIKDVDDFQEEFRFTELNKIVDLLLKSKD